MCAFEVTNIKCTDDTFHDHHIGLKVMIVALKNSLVEFEIWRSSFRSHTLSLDYVYKRESWRVDPTYQ